MFVGFIGTALIVAKVYVRSCHYEAWLIVLWMGIASGVVGVVSFYFLVAHIGSELALTANYLVPVVGDIIAAVFLGSWKNFKLSDYLFQIGGSLFVVVGLILCSVDSIKNRATAKSKTNPELNSFTDVDRQNSLPIDKEYETEVQ